jgi:hypothetical protein
MLQSTESRTKSLEQDMISNIRYEFEHHAKQLDTIVAASDNAYLNLLKVSRYYRLYIYIFL